MILPRGEAANYPWTNTTTGTAEYWTNGTFWGQVPTTYPGSGAGDNAYLTNSIAGSYTNIYDFTIGRTITTLGISNNLGEAWLIVTNSVLTNTTLSVGTGGRLRIDTAGVVTNVTTLNLNRQGGQIYVNGGKLFTGGSLKVIGNGASNNLVEVSNGGVWNNGGQSLYIGSGSSTGNTLVVNGGVLTNVSRLWLGDQNVRSDYSSLIISNGGIASADVSVNADTLYWGANGTIGHRILIDDGTFSSAGGISLGVGALARGGTGGSHTLTVTNGGYLTVGGLWVSGYVGGSGFGSSSNTTIIGGVNGSGSNATLFLRGGQLQIGGTAGSTNNLLQVGTGGLVTNVGAVTIGANTGTAAGSTASFNNGLRIDGGRMFSTSALIGTGSASNFVEVSNGGYWSLNGNNITLGSTAGTGNVLVVSGNAVVTNVALLLIGTGASSAGNSVTITNGGRFFGGAVSLGTVANASGNYYFIDGGVAGSVVSNGLITIANSSGAISNWMQVANVTLRSQGLTMGGNTFSSNNTVTVNTGTEWDFLGNALTFNAGTNNQFVLNGGAVTNVGGLTLNGAGTQLYLTNATGQGSLHLSPSVALSVGGTAGSGGNVLVLSNQVFRTPAAVTVGNASSGNSLTILTNTFWDAGNQTLTIGTGAATNNLFVVDGGLMTNVGAFSMIGVNSSVVISNGATFMTRGEGRFGEQNGSSNTLYQVGGLGASSFVSNGAPNYPIVLGPGPAGIGTSGHRLIVTNATLLTRGSLGVMIGDGSSNNTAQVLSGALWNMLGSALHIGGASAGRLNAFNTMTIDGGATAGGAIVTNAGAINIGNVAQSTGNSLIVTNGANFFSGAVNVGTAVNASNNLYAIDGGSVGAVVSNGAITIGSTGGGFNRMTVTNAQLITGGLVTVGTGASNNTVTVRDNVWWTMLGGATVGTGAATGNLFTVTGSTITNYGALTIGGGAGRGTLTMESGEWVQQGNTITLGVVGGSYGALVATSGVFNGYAAGMIVGSAGTGEVRLANSTLAVTNFHVALSAGSVGNVWLTNSSLSVYGSAAGTFSVGTGGRGTLTISNSSLFVTNTPIYVGLGGASTGTLNFNGGVVTNLGTLAIASGNASGTGVFNQTAGTWVQQGNVTFGNTAGAASPVGYFNLMGGSFQVLAGNAFQQYGNSGFSTFSWNITNATLAITNVVNGFQMASYGRDLGTLTLSAGGIISNANAFDLGVGTFSTGWVWQVGGNWYQDGATRIGASLASGNFALSNGTFYARSDVAVGAWGFLVGSGRGTLTIAGGNMVVDGGGGSLTNLIIGGNWGAQGFLNLSSGSLLVTNFAANTLSGIRIGAAPTVSGNSVGTLTMSGGALTNLAALVLGFSDDAITTGTVVQSGGNWYQAGVTVLGTNRFGSGGVGVMIVTGGTFRAVNDVQVGAFGTAVGSLTVGGNALFSVTNSTTSAQLLIRRGVLTMDSGQLRADYLVATNSGANTAQFTFNSGTAVVYRAGVNSGSAFVVGDGSRVARLEITGNEQHNFGSGIILTNNSVFKSVGTITAGATGLQVKNGSEFSPGNSPGLLTVDNATWAGGGNYLWEIADFSGAAGADWDLLNVIGALDLTATSGDKFTIKLNTMGVSAANFNQLDDYTLLIASFGSLTGGFDVSKFNLDVSGFVNSYTGVWSINQAGNSFVLNYAGSAVSPDFVWNNVNGNWNVGGNWVGGVAPYNAVPADELKLQFTGSGSTGYNATNNAQVTTMNALLFNSTATATNVLSGTALTFSGTNAMIRQQNSGAFIISNQVVQATNVTFNGLGAGSVVLASNITGSGQITKQGAWNLILRGSNTFTGAVLVNGAGGTLTLMHQMALGITNSITVSNGTIFASLGTTAYNYGNNLSHLTNILITGTSSLWTNTGGLAIGTNTAVNNVVTLANGGRIGGNVNIGNSATAVGNSLYVTNGGQVSGIVNVGAAAGSTNNNVTVTGAGTATFGIVNVGAVANASNNLFIVREGGVANVSTANVGAAASAVGNTMLVTNGGSIYGVINIGANAGSSNNLFAVIGGTGTLGTVNVGTNASRNNRMFVTNTTLFSAGPTVVGGGSSNNLIEVLADAAWDFRNNNLTIGTGSATGNVFAVRTGGTITNANLIVGNTVGSLRNTFLVDGGTAYVNSVVMNPGGGGTRYNSVVVTNGLLYNSGSFSLAIDASLSNSLVVLSGATVFNQSIHMRSASSILVDGPSAVLTNAGSINMGVSGAFRNGSNSEITITNGGLVYATSLYMGSGDAAAASNNLVRVTGTGSSLVITGEIVVGGGQRNNSVSMVTSNRLLITDGGAVISGSGTIGSYHYNPGTANGTLSSSNLVVVSDSGSRWIVGAGGLTVGGSAHGRENALVVTNGGLVAVAGNFRVGNGQDGGGDAAGPGYNNRAFIAGGTLFATNAAGTATVTVGGGSGVNVGSNNSMTVSMGGVVVSSAATIGNPANANSNIVIITGTGTRWENRGVFTVGNAGASNQLTLADAATLSTTGLVIGAQATSVGNRVWVTNANFAVTNAAQTARLVVGGLGQGTFDISGVSTVTVDQLVVTNAGANVNRLVLNSGTLSVRTSMVANATEFVVGDGVNAATLRLLTGGHVFNNGLVVTNAGTLDMAGGTTGAVTNKVGGLVSGFGTITGAVLNQSTLQATNGILAVTGIISGTGTNIAEQSGTLLLLGLNSYATPTWANGGTVMITNDANLGATASVLQMNDGGKLVVLSNAMLGTARSIEVNTGGGFIDPSNQTTVVNSVISGAGSLGKLGTGTVVLAAANTYTGGTVISNGTLQVGNGTTTGSLGGGLVQNFANLTFNRSDIFTNAPSIAGVGSVTKAGSGTLVFTNGNSYTGTTFVNTGTLAAGAANVFAQQSVVQVANGATLNAGAFDNSFGGLSGNGRVTAEGALSLGFKATNVTFSGLISGGGSITKAGIGTQEFTTAQSYTGGTVISGGLLKVNNATGSGLGSGDVSVNSGGTLGGTGMITGAVTVNSGGRYAPGNSVGVQTVGSLTMNAGSIFNFEFNGVNNDQIIASSTDGLTINGGGFNLYHENSLTTFDAAGLYYLIGYTGTIGGAGISSLSVLNATLNRTYAFGLVGGYVTLGIGGTAGWSGSSPVDANWMTSLNWFSGTPAEYDSLLFDGNTRLINTNNFLAGTRFTGLTFTNTAGAFQLDGNRINLVGDIVNRSANIQTLNMDLTLEGGSRELYALGGNLVLNGGINEAGGSLGLIKSGTRTVTLTGNNTYTGGTLVNAGTLLVNNTVGSGTGSGAVSVQSGATLGGLGTITGAVTINAGGSLSASAGGTLTLTQAPVVNGVAAVGNGSTLNVLPAWRNTTTVHMQGGTVMGGNLTNTTGALMQGRGAVVAQLINQAGASVVATNGELRLSAITGAGAYEARSGGTLTFTVDGSVSTLANPSGTVRLEAMLTNNTVFVNAGTLALAGGTYQTTTRLTNSVGATIKGYGTLNTAGLLNQGTLFANGGTLGGFVVNSVFTNTGTVRFLNTIGTFAGAVVNQGAWEVDPTTNVFLADFTVTASGSISATAGDVFIFRSNFVNQSTQSTTWNTLGVTPDPSSGSGTKFLFEGTGLTQTQQFFHVGLLLTDGFVGTPSPTATGIQNVSAYVDVGGFYTNFAVGTLELTNTTVLLARTAPGTGALFVNDLLLASDARLIISNDMRVYFINSNAWSLANITLLGNAQIHQLSGEGLLVIPEPSTWLMWLGGALALFYGRRRKTDL